MTGPSAAGWHGEESSLYSTGRVAACPPELSLLIFSDPVVSFSEEEAEALGVRGVSVDS